MSQTLAVVDGARLTAPSGPWQKSIETGSPFLVYVEVPPVTTPESSCSVKKAAQVPLPGDEELHRPVVVPPLVFHVKVPPEVSTAPEPLADPLVADVGVHELRVTVAEALPPSLAQVTFGVA